MCILSGNQSYTCACPQGSELTTDKFKCKKSIKDQVLVIGMSDRILTYHHNEFGRTSQGKGNTLPLFVSKLAYNSLSGDIFIADNIEGNIYLYNIESLSLAKLVTHAGFVTAMAFGNIFLSLFFFDSRVFVLYCHYIICNLSHRSFSK